LEDLEEIVNLEYYNDFFLRKTSNVKSISAKIEMIINTSREAINDIFTKRREEIIKEISEMTSKLRNIHIKIEPFRKKIENQGELKRTEE